MIPYGHQYIDKKDINSVIDVLNSDFLTQGPKIEEFEKKLNKYCNSRYSVVCVNGTSALLLAYRACGLRNGDEVITTPNSFVATTNMLLMLGVKPVFCDIRMDTYNIDENEIEKLITKKTKAIVVVHFSGHSCEMETIYKIAKKYKLLIIEDAAQALGASYKNSKIGSCKYSDITISSFHPVKSITTGEGGVIFTNNKKYYEKLILLRNHGIYKDKNGKNVMTDLSANYRMTDIQAALGISQLDKINNFIKKRRQVIKWYKKELRELKEIILPVELDKNYSAWHIYIIRIKNSKLRDKLLQYLKNNGIGANFHYPAIYSHPYYRKNGYKNIKLKNEEIYQNSCITLPCYTSLKLKDIKYIKKIIKLFIKNNNKDYEKM